MSEHNYIKKINKLIRQGKLPQGISLTKVDVYHDDWCGIFQGKRCNCDPEINAATIWREGQQN